MDKATHFTLIAKRILRELSVLNQSIATLLLKIQQQIEAISKQQYAEKERNQTPPVLRAELQIPEAIEHKREAENRKKARREWYGLLLNFLTLAAIVAYAIINYHMLRQIRREADAANRSATVAEGQFSLAQRSLGATIDSFRLEQRAWLDVKIRPNTRPEAGKSLDIRITVKNNGRTPAVNIRSVTVRTAVFKRDSPNLTLPKPTFKRTDYVSEGILAPDSTHYSDFVFPITSEDISGIDTMQFRIYVFGRTDYEDVFKRSHWVTFCGFLLPSGGFAICPEHNDMDKDNSKNPN